jgi:AraC family transcriptional regulator
MNWVNKMNEVIDYIEENITSEIELEDLAKIAFVSYYHFTKLFSALCGVGLSEYIRNRRLTLAAMELANKKQKVIDIGYKYGYQTPESFSRAFKKFHGVNPKDVKKNVSLVHYPRISLQILIKGEETMNYMISATEELYFLGKSIKFAGGSENLKIEAPKLWRDVMDNGGYQRLKGYSKKQGLVGLVYDINPKTNDFSYLVGVNVEKGTYLEGYDNIKIPGSKYAVFKSVGPVPESLNKMKNKIFTEWATETTYILKPTAEFEIYSDDDRSKEDYICEYWISIE